MKCNDPACSRPECKKSYKHETVNNPIKTIISRMPTEQEIIKATCKECVFDSYGLAYRCWRHGHTRTQSERDEQEQRDLRVYSKMVQADNSAPENQTNQQLAALCTLRAIEMRARQDYTTAKLLDLAAEALEKK